MSKFRTGYLIKDILDRLTDKTKNLLMPNRSMWVYSAHDITIATILHSIGISNVKHF